MSGGNSRSILPGRVNAHLRRFWYRLLHASVAIVRERTNQWLVGNSTWTNWEEGTECEKYKASSTRNLGLNYHNSQPPHSHQTIKQSHLPSLNLTAIYSTIYSTIYSIQHEVFRHHHHDAFQRRHRRPCARQLRQLRQYRQLRQLSYWRRRCSQREACYPPQWLRVPCEPAGQILSDCCVCITPPERHPSDRHRQHAHTFSNRLGDDVPTPERNPIQLSHES